MRTIRNFIITGLLINLAMLVACGPSNKALNIRQHAIEGDTITWQSSKWYDEGDTFALRIYALPVENAVNKIQAMETCKKALEVNAGAQLVGFFNGLEINDAAGTKNAQLTGMATTAETAGLIRHIRLINVTMAAEDPSQGCTAMAVVTQRGLRKKVESGAFIVRR